MSKLCSDLSFHARVDQETRNTSSKSVRVASASEFPDLTVGSVEERMNRVYWQMPFRHDLFKTCLNEIRYVDGHIYPFPIQIMSILLGPPPEKTFILFSISFLRSFQARVGHASKRKHFCRRFFSASSRPRPVRADRRRLQLLPAEENDAVPVRGALQLPGG